MAILEIVDVVLLIDVGRPNCAQLVDDRVGVCMSSGGELQSFHLAADDEGVSAVEGADQRLFAAREGHGALPRRVAQLSLWLVACLGRIVLVDIL